MTAEASYQGRGAVALNNVAFDVTSARKSVLDIMQREVESAAVQLRASGVASFTLVGNKLTCTASEEVSEKLCTKWANGQAPITLASYVLTHGVMHRWSCCGSGASRPARHSDALDAALPSILQVIRDMASKIATLMQAWKAQTVCPECAAAIDGPNSQKWHFVRAHVDPRAPIPELDEVYAKAFFRKILSGGEDFPTAASIEAAVSYSQDASGWSSSSSSSASACPK